MRRAAKIDANQPDIVAALRGMGATVEILSAVGKGCPDLLIGYLGLNALAELKDGSLSPSRRKLTSDQVEWHAAWRGSVTVIESVDQALALLKGMSERAMPR